MKKVLLLLLITMMSISVFAGDRATFVNVGFSDDGKYFLFGQHGFLLEESKAYGELYLVDVAANSFVSGGIVKKTFHTAIEPGQSSQGALFSLLEGFDQKRANAGINFLTNGRPLYIRVEGADSDASVNNLDFRDFETGDKYTFSLTQSVWGEGSSVSSSFYIDMALTSASGTEKNVRIGLPDYKRAGIKNYMIDRIIVGPNNASLIVIVAKQDYQLNTRYMVETVKLK